MPELGIFGKIIILQMIVVAVAVYVLMRLLDRDLVLIAIERARGFQPSEEAKKAEKIVVIAAGKLSADWQAQLSSALKKKCFRAEIEFLENPTLRGGLVVEIAGEVWDYSLMNRLKHLFQ